ncbi:MAG: AmmeMemoRadiSam system protein B [Candidatus Pacearchaeota archaeon]
MDFPKSKFSGFFYEKNEKELIKQIKKFFSKVKTQNINAKAIITAHAGYNFSGLAMATSYKALGDFDKIVLFATNHNFPSSSHFIIPNKIKGIELPLGKIKFFYFDIPYTKKDDNAIINEHSIEVQLPFIKYLNENAEVFPIIVNTYDLSIISMIIDKILEKDNFKFVFTSDFTHYGINYGFVPFEEKGKKLIEKIHLLDKEIIEKIILLDIENFIQESKKTTICGSNVIACSIELAKKLNLKPILLNYYTSAEVTKDYNEFAIVGYASIAFK